MRKKDLFLHLQIVNAGYRCELLASGFREAAEGFKIVSEYFQNYLRAYSRLQMVNSVADWLSDGDRQRQSRQLFANICQDFRFGRVERTRSTSTSLKWTLSACSWSSARPVRRPTDFTSGASDSSFSPSRLSLCDSASEMPGWTCRACHQVGSAAKNTGGPALNGLFGRKAGIIEGFNYSPANRNSGITLDEVTFRNTLRIRKQKCPGLKRCTQV